MLLWHWEYFFLQQKNNRNKNKTDTQSGTNVAGLEAAALKAKFRDICIPNLLK